MSDDFENDFMWLSSLDELKEEESFSSSNDSLLFS